MTSMISIKTISIYVVLCILFAWICNSFGIIYLCDYRYAFFVINITGVYLLLTNIKIDIELYWSVKY